jgi:PBP superfamily domain
VRKILNLGSIWIAVLGVVLAAKMAVTSAAPAPAPAPDNLQLNAAGATFPYPIYSKWFDAYHKAHPEVAINYQSIGSGGGIQQLHAGTVDFGASDMPLNDELLQKLNLHVNLLVAIASVCEGRGLLDCAKCQGLDSTATSLGRTISSRSRDVPWKAPFTGNAAQCSQPHRLNIFVTQP